MRKTPGLSQGGCISAQNPAQSRQVDKKRGEWLLPGAAWVLETAPPAVCCPQRIGQLKACPTPISWGAGTPLVGSGHPLEIESLNVNSPSALIWWGFFHHFFKMSGIFCLLCHFKCRGSDFPEMQSPALLICADLYVLQPLSWSYKYPQLGQGKHFSHSTSGNKSTTGAGPQVGLWPGKQKPRKILNDFLIEVI